MTQIKLLVTLTWSKIMAFVLVGCAVVLDFRRSDGAATAFMFTVPFAAALILGKQYIDYKDKTKIEQ